MSLKEKSKASVAISRKKKLTKLTRWLPVFLMMTPGIIYLFINNYMPLVGLVIAFKKVNFSLGIMKSPWVGFDNFEFLFKTPDAFVITRNTIVYNLIFILINNVIGILIAILISEVNHKKAKTVYQSSILLPFLMSWVIVSYIVFAFLGGDNGMLNNSILPALGMESISWYTQPKLWPVILILVNLWKGVGYGCLIYIASITGIETSYFEAAALDGAGKLRQIKYVTLPALTPAIITLVLISIGRIFFSDFGLFYQIPMNSGQLYSTTNVIDTYVYRGLLQFNSVSMSSAAGFYQSCVGFVFVIFINGIVKKFSPDNSLF